MVSIDFINQPKPRCVVFFKCILKKYFREILPLIKKIGKCQRMCVCEDATLLSNSILRNLAKIMLWLRVMTNLGEIFEKS